ncbi:MAG: glycosyltransferase family 2 protein [Bacteroidetes bacterium]|nr:glycosyltransferase family 2 protein [Bacteroidota bacterium]
MKPEISIIIVSYKVRDLILKCLQTVFESEKKSEIEVIVIDNNSSDDSVSEIKKHFPQVILLENKHNVGFSEANNQGLRMANGIFIFLLNPDTEISPNTLNLLEEHLQKNPKTKIVAPRLLNSDKSIQQSAWKNHKLADLFLELFFLHGIFNFKNYPVSRFNTETEIETASGAALFFRKELVTEIGELDKNLFWTEDIDFCFRAHKTGNIVYLPQAQVIHHSGKSSKTNFNIPVSNQIISKIKYFKKHHSLLTFILSVVLSYMQVFSRIILFLCLAPFINSAKYKFKAYVYTFKKLNRYIFLNEQKVF